MINRKTKISYGKNVYNNEEINAVIKTLKNSTKMSTPVKNFKENDLYKKGGFRKSTDFSKRIKWKIRQRKTR